MDDEKTTTSGETSQTIASGDAAIAGVSPYAVTIADGDALSLVFDDGAPVKATMRVGSPFAELAAPWLELDQQDPAPHDTGRPKRIYLRPVGPQRIAPVTPVPSFEESVKQEQEKTTAWIVDLLERVAPRLKELFSRPVNTETPVALSEVYGHIEERIASVVEDHVGAMEVRVFDKLKQLFAGKGELAAAATSQTSQTKTTPAPAARPNLIEVGSPVKVWNDPEKKTFRSGRVLEAHDGGHSFDVQLDDGTAAHVQADGLELDELAS